MSHWKRVGSSCALVAALALLAGNGARAGDEPSLEIGAGTLKQDAGEMTALFRLDVKSGNSGQAMGGRLFVVKLRGDLAAVLGGAKPGVPYLDASVDLLTFEDQESAEVTLGLTALTFSLRRDLALGNAYTARISMLGFRLNVGNPDLEKGAATEPFLRLALDLLGVAFTKHVDIDSRGPGYGMGGQLETGIEFSDRFRILIGGQFDWSHTADRHVFEVEPYYSCWTETYYDEWGEPYQVEECAWFNTIEKSDSALNAKVYLDAMLKLTSSLSVFFKGGYALYKYDETSLLPSVAHKKGGWFWMAGGSVRF